MSSTIKKLFGICSILLLVGISKSTAQQDCNASSVTMSCNNLVNLSIGPTCSQAIKAEDLLTTNSFSCYNNFTVNILNTNLGNTIGPAQVGKTYDVKVTHTISGNACWGKVKVEDKTAPTITCTPAPITVTCAAPDFKTSNGITLVFDNILNNGIRDTNATVSNRPVVDENCGGYTLTYSDNVQNMNCGTTGLIAVVTRTWKAVDAQGNAATCAQTYHVTPAKLADITIPSDVTLDCSDTFPLDSKGNPSPSFTGYPKINNIQIDGVTTNLCQISMGYLDAKTIDNCAGYIVVRKWTLTNWCEDNGGTWGPSTRQVEQVIQVKDTKKPVFISWNLPAVIGVDNNRCYRETYTPVAPVASDNCDNQLDFFYELYNEDQTILITKGNVLKNIPTGKFVLVVKATDDCGNNNTTSQKIEVKDLLPPVPACHQNTKVSLRTDGTAVVNATSFNDGSVDNCCIDTSLFMVKRMSEDDNQFRKTIQFNCNDASVQVILRVSDCSGNTNTCMVNAIVEDKIPPVLFVQDGAVSCGGEPRARQWLDDHKPTEKTLLNYPTPNNPGYFDNCSATLTFVDIVGIDQCSKGSIKRVWTATDKNGNTNTAIQTVTVSNISSYKVIYPKDTVITCDKANGDLSPNVTGTPTIIQDANSCANVTYTYEDKFIGSDNCRRISRTWKVANLCATMTATPTPNVYEEGIQMINIIDVVAPTIGNVEIETVDAVKACYATRVELKHSGFTDNCAANVSVAYTSNIPNYSAGFLPATLVDVPYGKYKVTYRATDGCGNVATKDIDLVIKDSQKPTAVCHDNIALSLGSAGQAMLLANRVNRLSSDNCTPNDKLKFRIQVPAPAAGATFDITKTDTMYIFRCPTTPLANGDTITKDRTYSIGLWVGDESDNWDFCTTTINVQDNMNMCPVIYNVTKVVAGNIQTANKQAVEGVSIQLAGNDISNTVATDVTGYYAFDKVKPGVYELTPQKNDYPLNGVSTFDLIQITKHLLSITPFSTYNQYIAADVNANGSISNADIVELRRMILGLQTGFTKNTSWRFVEKGIQYDIAQPEAWLPRLPSSKTLLDLNQPTVDFTAIKVGDLNQNAKASSAMQANPRTLTTTTIDVNTTDDNGIVNVGFSANTSNTMEGYQLALQYDKSQLELIDIKGDREAFAVLEEGLITHSQITANTDAQGQLFGLSFRKKQNTVDVTNAIKINETVLAPEAYINNGTINNVVLKFNNGTAVKNTFEVYQNQPNPFNNTTVIGFQLPEAATVQFTLTDISGRVIKHTSQAYTAGYQQILVDRNELNTSGVLYYTITNGTQRITKKMIIIE